MANYKTIKYREIVDDLVRYRLLKEHSSVKVGKKYKRINRTDEERDNHVAIIDEVVEAIKHDMDLADQMRKQKALEKEETIQTHCTNVINILNGAE